MQIKFEELKTMKKLLQESSSDFLDKPKENKFMNFVNNNKTSLVAGATGLVGAAGLGYLGNNLGEQYGISAHAEDLDNTKTQAEFYDNHTGDILEKKEALEKFQPESGLSIDEYLLKHDGVNKVLQNIEAERERQLANIDPNDTEAKSRIWDNYNAQKTYLFDRANENLNFMGIGKEGEVKDVLGGNIDKIEPNFLKRMFQNDDLDNPTPENIKNRQAIDNLVKRAKTVHTLNNSIDPEKIPEYNKQQIPIVEKNIDKELEQNAENFNNAQDKIKELSNPNTVKDYQSKYGAVGTGIGAVVGGGASAVTAAKLANLAKEKQLAKEEELKNKYNNYNEKLPEAHEVEEPKKNESAPGSILNLR